MNKSYFEWALRNFIIKIYLQRVCCQEMIIKKKLCQWFIIILGLNPYIIKSLNVKSLDAPHMLHILRWRHLVLPGYKLKSLYGLSGVTFLFLKRKAMTFFESKKLTNSMRKNMKHSFEFSCLPDSASTDCVNMCTCTHGHVYTSTHVRMYMYTCVHVYTCTHVHVYTCTHAHMYTCKTGLYCWTGLNS